MSPVLDGSKAAKRGNQLLCMFAVDLQLGLCGLLGKQFRSDPLQMPPIGPVLSVPVHD